MPIKPLVADGYGGGGGASEMTMVDEEQCARVMVEEEGCASAWWMRSGARRLW